MSLFYRVGCPIQFIAFCAVDSFAPCKVNEKKVGLANSFEIVNPILKYHTVATI